MEERQVIWINDQRARDWSLSGGKSSRLAHLSALGFPVPIGFSLTPGMVASLATSPIAHGQLVDEIRAAYDTLSERKRQSSSVIVRSSALQEDAPSALFPGVFCSIGGVATFSDLLLAVKECYLSTRGSRAQSYCRLHGIPIESLRMALLVQEHLLADFAGVAFSEGETPAFPSGALRIEVSAGSAHRMLRGGDVAYVYSVSGYPHSTTIRHERIAGQRPPPDALLLDVARLVGRVDEVLGQPQLVEWVSANDSICLVQARTMRLPSMTRRRGLSRSSSSQFPKPALLPGEAEIGLKGAGMRLFAERGWFSKKVVFGEPDSTMGQLERAIQEAGFPEGGLTVRFSYGDEIGLPRYFAKGATEAIEFLRHVRKPEWFVIVHEYLDIRHSFELYCQSDRFVLEHVPGIWESWTELAPDVIVKERAGCEAFRVIGSRHAVAVTPYGKMDYLCPPVAVQQLHSWRDNSLRFLRFLSTILPSGVPVICHAVADVTGDWQFLNIRRTRTLGGQPLRGGTSGFHVVRSVEDLAVWDKTTPLLLRLNVERGDEDLLEEIVEALGDEQVDLFIDFGILSHPAIMLREFGLQLKPVYASHEKVVLSTTPEDEL